MSHFAIASSAFVSVPTGVLNTSSAGPLAINRFELQKTQVTVEQWRAFLSEHTDQPFARFEQMPDTRLILTEWGTSEESLPSTPTTIVRRIVPTTSDWEYRFKEAFMGHWQLNAGDARPASLVDYFEAAAFAAVMGGRLPTQHEHEYAAKAGQDVSHGTDDGELHHPRFDGVKANAQWNASEPINVKSFAPNPWGLYDMCGNVSEWCASIDSRKQLQALGGGSYSDENYCFGHLQAAFNSYMGPNAHFLDIGFRVARDVA